MFLVALFVLYFIVLLFAIHRIARKRIYNFSFLEIAAIFTTKALLGCLYGYIFLKYYHGDDTWNFFNDSIPEYRKMISHFDVFLKDLLPSASFQNAKTFTEGMGFYLRDLEYWTMIKLLAIFNLFSRSNYYIDVLFFNAVTCWGSFLLFKMLISILPDKKNILLITIFFIPSIIFWLSGIRGEALLFLFIMLLIYHTWRYFQQKKVVHIIWILIAVFGFLTFRALYLLIFLPAYFSWIIAKNGKRKPIFYFLVTYTTSLLIFIAGMILMPTKNLSDPIVKQQAAFFKLHGNTRFDLDTLKPSISSFVKLFPQAISNTFARPFLWEARGPLQWVAALEVIGIWILIGLSIFRPGGTFATMIQQPLFLLFLFYGISQILLVGYIVPFPGAIVRYKIIPELFIIIVLATSVQWRNRL